MGAFLYYLKRTDAGAELLLIFFFTYLDVIWLWGCYVGQWYGIVSAFLFGGTTYLIVSGILELKDNYRKFKEKWLREKELEEANRIMSRWFEIWNGGEEDGNP